MKVLNKLKEIIKKERNISFKELSDNWLKSKKISIKESTYYHYIYFLNKYILPTMENVKLKELEDYNYNNFIIKLAEDLSAKTIRDLICILKSILYYANEEYKLNINIKKIKSPKLVKNKVVIFSNREKGRLENYCIKENSLKSIGIIICLNTGLRVGELCALQWKNIDLDRRILFVKHTVQRVYDDEKKKTRIVMDLPKTASSIREVPISNKLFDILKLHKKKYKDENFFLSGESDKIIEPRNYEKYYKQVLKKCKIKSYKMHTLRHYFATNCINVGMDIKSLSEILGHSSVEVTLEKYVHPDLKTQKRYLEKL